MQSEETIQVFDGAPEAEADHPKEVCEVCGLDVPSGDVVRAELSVGDMMCPTSMVFHKACYERASELWQPNEDSYCTTDPDFPETQQWTPSGSAGS